MSTLLLPAQICSISYHPLCVQVCVFPSLFVGLSPLFHIYSPVSCFPCVLPMFLPVFLVSPLFVLVCLAFGFLFFCFFVFLHSWIHFACIDYRFRFIKAPFLFFSLQASVSCNLVLHSIIHNNLARYCWISISALTPKCSVQVSQAKKQQNICYYNNLSNKL